MVSFWPWKAGNDAASFERTLNTITGKITRATATNDRQRHLSRRARVMWTLYAGFAYILAALLLTLVTGWKNWGIVEGTVVAGGPVLIYGMRYALTSYFDYRISNTDAYIAKLTKERDATIERLKESTKYNSTQQLLEKYGGSPKQKEPGSSPGRKKPQGPQNPNQPQAPRTGIPPPPTANIQRPSNQQPQTAVRPSSPSGPKSPHVQSLPQQPRPSSAAGAEFAPNAFGASELVTQYSATPAATFTQTHWYDRILDALLGEDETSPKNRFALICSECRLVNGQAPPGARTLEDVGRWRCGGCSAWNGKEKPRDDVAGLVKGWEAERKARDAGPKASVQSDIDSDNAETEDNGVVNVVKNEVTRDESREDASTPPPPSKSTRRKGKGKK